MNRKSYMLWARSYLHVMQCVDEEWHIQGPCYLEDDEGTVLAEGICCREHAQWMADGYNRRTQEELDAETSQLGI